jgi:glycosyltransferase involved in cell wall biosynthesis
MSIQEQIFDDYEVIILDDLSTDNSREVIAEFSHYSKISNISFNDINSGSPFHQWKKGIEMAKGEWIWIAESDDWCEPSFLDSLSVMFNKGTKYSLGFCQNFAVRDDGSIIMNTENPKLEESISGEAFVERRMLNGNAINNASMAVFRKELFYKVSDRFTKYKFCGDWLFWIEIALHGDVFISGKILDYFRKHDRDVSTEAFRSGLYFFEYLQLVSDLSELKIVNPEQKLDMVKRNYRHYCFNKPSDFSKRRELIGKYKQELGSKFFTYSARVQYERMLNRLDLYAMAVKNRL